MSLICNRPHEPCVGLCRSLTTNLYANKQQLVLSSQPFQIRKRPKQINHWEIMKSHWSIGRLFCRPPSRHQCGFSTLVLFPHLWSRVESPLENVLSFADLCSLGLIHLNQPQAPPLYALSKKGCVWISFGRNCCHWYPHLALLVDKRWRV